MLLASFFPYSGCEPTYSAHTDASPSIPHPDSGRRRPSSEYMKERLDLWSTCMSGQSPDHTIERS
uniref:Uncharacterized protein n=1 Tax=Rhizophora mucronata TaxID=61149 RepID=A0A2P2PXW7_RHIMU